jgi:LuxR family transcriptional regulator, maltose regulon positive regulatory protein
MPAHAFVIAGESGTHLPASGFARQAGTRTWRSGANGGPVPIFAPTGRVKSYARKEISRLVELPLTDTHADSPAERRPPPKLSMWVEAPSGFISTKIVPPPCRGLIPRPRLLKLVSELPNKRLAVIRAQAGFGKTSLAAAWAELLRQSNNVVAWLTIDPEDDESQRFMLYVSQALEHAHGGLGRRALALLRESFLIVPNTIASTLINDLAEVDDEIYLFMDNYHWVTHSRIHDGIALAVKHAPSNFHLVLTSRQEPPLPLVSLRAANQLLEVETSALRFDLQETRQFLEQEANVSPPADDVAVLHGKTEGWPAAVRIAASASPHLPQDFGRYVRSLSAAQRTIGAYLAEMLDGLPANLGRFMLRTAILGRLSVPLCEAVTQEGASSELLASIMRRQLLLIPLDEECRWYRYHALLADYLSRRLHAEFADELPALHRRAALWYASQELWTEAVQHAFSAGDTERALAWLKNFAMDLIKRGDLFTLLGWQRLLPPDLTRSQPEVRLAIAWGLALAMRCDECLQLLEEIEPDIDTGQSDDAKRMASECRGIRAVAGALKDDSEGGLALAQSSLNSFTDQWTTGVSSNVIRFGHMKAGELQKFYATPRHALSLNESTSGNVINLFALVYRCCLQGMAEFQQVRVAAADRYYCEGLRLAENEVGPNSLAAAVPSCLLALVRYEQGRLDEAEAMLIDRIAFIDSGVMLECVLSAYFVMARVAAFRRNFERSHALLEKAEDLGTRRGWGRVAAGALAERARLYFDEGRIQGGAACLDRLERLAAQHPVTTRCAWSDIHRYAILARAYFAAAENRLDEAISLLQDLKKECESASSRYLALRASMHLSIMLLRARQVAKSLDEFSDVAAVAAHNGIRRIILDEGAKLDALLAEFHSAASKTAKYRALVPYVSGLVGIQDPTNGSSAGTYLSSAGADGLTAREDRILRLIADGLSNKAMARELAIAPETVKSHVKHIFTKLGVEKRAQAVSRAQSLGLLSTQPA